MKIKTYDKCLMVFKDNGKILNNLCLFFFKKLKQNFCREWGAVTVLLL